MVFVVILFAFRVVYGKNLFYAGINMFFNASELSQKTGVLPD